VTIGLSCGDFISDVVLYAIKIVASFYRYNTNIYNEMWWVVYVFVSNSLGYVSAKNWQNWMTSDKDTKIKRLTFFSETQCIIIMYAYIRDVKSIL